MNLSQILALVPSLTPERRKILLEHYQHHALTEEETDELFHYITHVFAMLRQQAFDKSSVHTP